MRYSHYLLQFAFIILYLLPGLIVLDRSGCEPLRHQATTETVLLVYLVIAVHSYVHVSFRMSIRDDKHDLLQLVFKSREAREYPFLCKF